MSLDVIMDNLSFPLEIIEEVKKQLKVTETCLTGTGFLDAVWTGYDNHLIILERKEVHDLAGRVDDLERQLKRAIEKVGSGGEVILLIEGVFEPIENSTILYKKSRDKNVIYRDRVVGRPYAYYMSFLWALDKLGVSTFWTSSFKGTAEALVAFVKESNKSEYTTFARYIKSKPKIKSLNPQVERLMGLGVGEKRAEALIERFGTVWNVLSAKPEDLAATSGVGIKTATQILKNVGKRK